MFIVLLKFSTNKTQAPNFIESHNHWIKQGFEDNVFLMVGSIKPGIGGSVLVYGESREALEKRVNKDPFVIENIVTAEILEIEPKKVDGRLEFLLSNEDGK